MDQKCKLVLIPVHLNLLVAAIIVDMSERQIIHYDLMLIKGAS